MGVREPPPAANRGGHFMCITGFVLTAGLPSAWALGWVSQRKEVRHAVAYSGHVDLGPVSASFSVETRSPLKAF